jgi:hypothetical protein
MGFILPLLLKWYTKSVAHPEGPGCDDIHKIVDYTALAAVQIALFPNTKSIMTIIGKVEPVPL